MPPPPRDARGPPPPAARNGDPEPRQSPAEGRVALGRAGAARARRRSPHCGAVRVVPWRRDRLRFVLVIVVRPWRLLSFPFTIKQPGRPRVPPSPPRGPC